MGMAVGVVGCNVLQLKTASVAKGTRVCPPGHFFLADTWVVLAEASVARSRRRHIPPACIAFKRREEPAVNE